MGDMLSQAEIDALLNGTFSEDTPVSSQTDISLSAQEIDALGEVGNISMGTSATTLFTLLGHKVMITTPKVTVTNWEAMSNEYVTPCVGVRVEFTEGLIGSNLLIMREDDVKIITDLMMGGEGNITPGELTDLHLSAISEAMNQMVGSSATSMSSMFHKRIDISPPKAFIMNFSTDHPYAEFDHSQKFVKIAFRMEVGDLIDSEIMQLIPISFAKQLVGNLLNNAQTAAAPKPKEKTATPAAPAANAASRQQGQPTYSSQPTAGYAETAYSMPDPGMYRQYDEEPVMQRETPRQKVNVQPAQFQNFDDSKITVDKKNIGLIMDVPLQVTVELGRTQKLIREILEFGPGQVIELEKLAGDPVDILVNGKTVAKGEVVVIDESFGVRITDIIHPSRRL